MTTSSFVIPTIAFKRGRAHIIDQTLLPGEYKIIELGTVDAMCDAIYKLRIRGAPALGVAGAYGLLVAVEERWGGDGYFFDEDPAKRRIDTFPASINATELRAQLEAAAATIGATRPTAINLGWALDRMMAVVAGAGDEVRVLLDRLVGEAVSIYHEDLDMCRALGAHGAELLADGDAVLTHCNTGGLATSGFGTALGVVFSAVESGKKLRVFADETRPLLQGARLTAWECEQNGIPVTVLVDGAAASLMSQGKVSSIIVGADRIAANGDTANKVGTLGVAIMAQRYGVPFYVAAPSSTIDTSLRDGSQIPIEQRPAGEVRALAGTPVTPPEVSVFNPAFDVTTNELITGIITEKGVFRPPYDFE